MPSDIPSSSTLTKADLVRKVYEQIGFSKKDSSALIETVLEIIKSSLEHGEEVKLSGFGKFTVVNREARPGRNPQTSETITIGKRRVLKFQASPILRSAINNTND